MPHKIILDDIFEEIFDDISYLKLNSYIHFKEEDDWLLPFFIVKIREIMLFLII
mgnify:FL=1